MKALLFDVTVFLLLLVFNTYTATSTNKSVINNRMFLYTLFYLLLGLAYPFLHTYITEKNLLLLKGIAKFLLSIIITQAISYSIYLFKSGAYKYDDSMGFVIFLSFFAYSILLTTVFYFIGYFINRQIIR